MHYFRHLKKLVEFATDFLLLCLFLTIIGISFWTAYNLNPKPVKTYSANSVKGLNNSASLNAGINSNKSVIFSNDDVLGLSVDGNSDNLPKLQITNIAVQDFKMMVLLQNNDMGTNLAVRLQDLDNKEITRNILQISNPTSQTQTLNFHPEIPGAYLQGMRYQIIINQKDYLIFDTNLNLEPQNFYAVFPPGAKATVTLKVTSQEAIAYPMDFHIEILAQ